MFGQISVKFSVLGSYTLIVAPIGVKFGTEEWTKVSSVPKSHKNVTLHYYSPNTTFYELSCKDACTDDIRIQTQNELCCFPSVIFGAFFVKLESFLTLICDSKDCDNGIAINASDFFRMTAFDMREFVGLVLHAPLTFLCAARWCH